MAYKDKATALVKWKEYREKNKKWIKKKDQIRYQKNKDKVIQRVKL